MQGRVKTIRKTLRLSQEEFAKKLGIKGASLSLIESGKNALTDQNIKLICMVFNVNESWLRTGTGEMFNVYSPCEQEFFKIFDKLSPCGRGLLLKIGTDILEYQEKPSGISSADAPGE
jgi:transcriptional regulator with XRE-family HTH domain